jgi:hypothetical protein
MQLNSSQLSILAEIGIAVWELRTASNDSVENLRVKHVTEKTELSRLRYSQSWIVVVDTLEANTAEQRLLYAMLQAINVNLDDVGVVARADFARLDLAQEINKVMLVFGKSNDLSETFGQSNKQASQDSILTIFTLGLDELLSNPVKKALAWQHLILAKKQYEQLVEN